MAFTVTMPLPETSKRLERDKTIVRGRERLERYGAMEYGLTQSNKIARENQRELERGRESQRESQRELERARESQTRERAVEEIWSYLDRLVTKTLTD